MNLTCRRDLLVLGVLLCAAPLFAMYLRSRLPDSLAAFFFRDSSSYYDKHIQNVCEQYDLDFLLVKALIRAESQFDHMAVSPRGAMGLMQLMPATARDMGVRNPFNPKENIEGGARYLRYLLKRFNNDLTLALAAYNAGPEVVKRYKGVPPYRETREYLKKVMGFYSDYRERT